MCSRTTTSSATVLSRWWWSLPASSGAAWDLRLLAAAEDACRTEKLFTSTNASNGAAQRLFASAGFVRSGQIEHLDEGDPELVYVKWCR